MSEQDIKQFILSLDDVKLDNRSTEDTNIYSYSNDEMMATIKNNSNPLRLSLRCDYNLAKLLKEQYESVVGGDRLNKKSWITILLTGQLSDDEVIDQIRHAYEQTKKLTS